MTAQVATLIDGRDPSVPFLGVPLTVATLIVVNSVMAGFAHEMHTRLHGILSDIFFESYAVEGMPDPEAHMAEIKRICGDDIQGMTATIQVPAMVMIPLRAVTA